MLLVGVAACGSDEGGTIPKDAAGAMLEQLDQVEANVEDGECFLAGNDADQLEDQVNSLPKQVGVETKDDLRTLVTQLQSLINKQCNEADTGATGATGASGVLGDDG